VPRLLCRRTGIDKSHTSRDAASPSGGVHLDYTACDATALAEHVARGDLHAADLVDVAIRAIEDVNPALNAVVHRMYEQARELAQTPQPGPFCGVPMVVKDFDGYVRDVPFTASCRFLDGFVPQHDSLAIARLRHAGFIFLAKTNCPELALLGTTEPEWRGPTRNPYWLERSTGGSSGGSAALVAARAVPLAHGGDGGGSLRVPASHCGLVGLKPTRGRIPLAPDLGEGWGGYTQWGVLTRSLRDTAAVFDVMAGPSPGDPYAAPPLPGPLAAELGRDPGALRIAFFSGSLYGRQTHPEHAEAVQRTAARLTQLGHHVEEARPSFDKETLVRAYLTQVAVSTAAEIDAFAALTGREPVPHLFEPATWFLNQVGHSHSALELTQARDAVQAASRTLGEFHARYDVFMCPTVTHPPVRLGQHAHTTIERLGLSLLRKLPAAAVLRAALAQLSSEALELTPNTQLFNQTGQPAISLPLALSRDGLPIGVQLAAACGREDLLMRVSAQLEVAEPWQDRRPPICV
jgi:amidase